MKKRLAALCFELPAPAGDAPPARITLIPAPGPAGRITGVDGRAWKLADASAVVAAFNRARAITENHSRVLAAPRGESAPAFGWIDRLQVSEDGGITAEVSWTPRGTAALAARDYRYLSPEFEFDAAGNITEIVGAALTNDPNFPQLALNHQGDEPELPVTLKAIAEALGLNPAADEASVLTAINSLKAENQTALNAAQHPDPTRFVPAEQHQVALNAKQAAETELATLKGTQRETEITQAVDEALKAGKIVPANRNYYLAMCRTEGGLEQFRQFAANAPVIGDPSAVTPSSEQDKATGLTPAEVALCAQCGISHEQYLKARDA